MRRPLLILAAMLAMAWPAHADDLSDAQTVIQGQADALARDDGAAAYDYAAPQIRTIFPEITDFMAMVKNGYAPVYRHKRFDFGEGKLDGGKFVQRVSIVDGDNVAWEAVYSLERQPDGTYKITGCVLLKGGQSV